MRSALSAVFAAAFGLAGLTTTSASVSAADLVIYTSQPQDQMADVIALFNEQYPDIEVEMYRDGTTKVLNKLRAEVAAGDPQPDILLIADSVTMTDLKNQDLLMAYEDAPVAGFKPEFYDADKTFFGTKLITTGIIYNTDAGVPAPTSWTDLLSEDAKGQVIFPNPNYSGAAVIHVGTMTQNPDFGWEFYDQLAANGAVAGTGNGSVRNAVASGEKAYGMIIEFMALGQKAEGSPVDFVFPTEGVSSITQPVAILKTAKNPNNAKKFIDFQLSEAAQVQSVAQKYFPLLDGVSPPDGYPDPATIAVMPVDAQQLLGDVDTIKRRFADIYGG